MTDLEPNPEQRRLIEGTEGVYLVDAGPGTGKTFAVTRRYAEIVDQPGVEPDDVLLATFTRSAATEMKERVVDRSSYGLRELADAPIQTFHSLCHDLLREHGARAPTHLGIDDRITGATRVVEDDLVERELFREFLDGFRDGHPEHADLFRAVDDPLELLDVVTQLAAKGVFPRAEGWYRDGGDALAGDSEAFADRLAERNEPRNGGRKQSELRAALGGFGSRKAYLPDAPAEEDLRGDRGTKRVDERYLTAAFEQDCADLEAFVHDVYHAYLAFALERNYLNFGFLQLFAYVLCCEDAAVRGRAEFDYVMVDEFQDTSELQFRLALLLCAGENLCVVGDWKQSIYSFQYADVDNIVEFASRLTDYREGLNADVETDRVSVDADDVERISLTENYRSTETLLEFSEEALVAPATSNETVDDDVLADVTSLSANASFDETTIEAIQHEDQHEAVLAAVQRIVGNDDYPVEDDDGDPRPPEYGDIAVLTRTREYGRELLAAADEYGLPMAYDGGVELFRTDPAKLLLAWLRILEADADRGWAVVLERAGYTLDEVDHLLSTAGYPGEMVAFREKLAALDDVGPVARRVFDRYGYDGEYADVVLHTLRSVHDQTTMTRGDLIDFVERAIDAGSTHDVHTSAGEDSVTVQTIHGAKGLEYPIVILANMNEGSFPPRSRDSGVVGYEEPIGLRQRKVYAEDGAHPHVYHSWRYDVLRECIPTEYDEERRLLYVAITRAESHVVFAAGEEPNEFLRSLPVDVESQAPDVDSVDETTTTQAQLPFTIAPPDGPVGQTPHTLMDDDVFDDDGGGAVAGDDGGAVAGDDGGAVAGDDDPSFQRDDPGGRRFGNRVHEFAEAYARGDDVTPSNDHEWRAAAYLDGVDGDLHLEQPARLPLDVDGERVTVSGIVDLVHVTSDRVEIVDYKTDRSRRAEEEYAVQLGVYYHVLVAEFPDRTVTTSLFYTADDELVAVEPPSRDELVARVRKQMRSG